MKRILFISLCITLFFVGFALVVGFRIVKTQLTAQPPSITSSVSPSLSVTPIHFKLEPPRQSLKGTVIRVDGTAMKLARDVEIPIVVSPNSTVLEGEQITASPSSAVNLQFGTKALITINPETNLAFPSTNPNNFLIKQDKGITVFETDEQVATISARSLRGLFTLSQGKAQLSVNPNSKLIEFMIVKGSGRVGYIDENNQTQIVELTEGDILTYDDNKRLARKN